MLGSALLLLSSRSWMAQAASSLRGGRGPHQRQRSSNRQLAGASGFFYLIDASTNLPVTGVSFVDGAVINVGDLPAEINVQAVPAEGAASGPILFAFDDTFNFRNERIAPFSLCGDKSWDFNACPIGLLDVVGSQHTITATPEVGAPFSITFSITDGDSGIPTAAPSTSPSGTPTAAPSDVPSSSPSFTAFPSDQPSDIPSSIPSDQPSDIPSSIHSDQPSDIPSSSPTEPPSDALFNSPSPTAAASTEIPTSASTSYPTKSPATSDVRYILVDADTDVDLAELSQTENTVVNRVGLAPTNFNVRVEAIDSSVVVMGVNFEGGNNEGLAPFAYWYVWELTSNLRNNRTGLPLHACPSH